jgi:uncharacterized protein (DUF427 family)
MSSEAERSRLAQGMWRYIGQERPPFAALPAAGQESVWDYPRPPRLATERREILILAGTREIARSGRALRLLETASAPTFYLPRADVDAAWLEDAAGGSICEWKGAARYLSVVTPELRCERVAWFYPEPLPGFEALQDHLGFYPSPLACFVGGVRALSQPGRFYAGWITPDVVGPFKGEADSLGW